MKSRKNTEIFPKKWKIGPFFSFFLQKTGFAVYTGGRGDAIRDANLVGWTHFGIK